MRGMWELRGALVEVKYPIAKWNGELSDVGFAQMVNLMRVTSLMPRAVVSRDSCCLKSGAHNLLTSKYLWFYSLYWHRQKDLMLGSTSKYRWRCGLLFLDWLFGFGFVARRKNVRKAKTDNFMMLQRCGGFGLPAFSGIRPPKRMFWNILKLCPRSYWWLKHTRRGFAIGCIALINVSRRTI